MMVRIYGWIEKSVGARSASGKSVVELDRRVFLFFPFFSFFFFFYNDIESIVSFSFLREWTGRGISLGRGELIRLLIGYILERLEEFLLDIFLFNY